MNSRQKEVLAYTAQQEQRLLKELKQVYAQAKKDTESKIRELSARTDMENLQSIIYQKKYQEVLNKQLTDILDSMNKNQVQTIDDYLHQCYETGFFGTLYDLQGQGVPLLFPINQEQVLKALETDSKLSTTLYDRMGEDVNKLKTSIRAELSRGIANGSSWNDVAVKISKGMNSPFEKSFNCAVRIARTEGARIQQEAQFNVQQKAKDIGADIVKQWDSTFDGRTRPTHMELDGQIKELDEPFEIPSTGKKALHPHAFGIPSEDINCRCQCLQRARWALNEDETKYLGDVSTMSDKRKEEIAEKLGCDVDELEEKSKSIVKLKSKKIEKFIEEAKEQTATKIGGLSSYPKKHQKEILKFLDEAPEECRTIWNELCEDFHAITGVEYKKMTGRTASGAFYSPYCDAVYLNISKVAKGDTIHTPYQTVFHEYGHHIDYILNRKYGDGNKKKTFTETFKDGIFGKTLEKEVNKAIEDFAKKNNITVPKSDIDNLNKMVESFLKSGYLKENEKDDYIKKKMDESLRSISETEFIKYVKSNYALIARSDISDMFEPFTEQLYPFGAGHGRKSYWKNTNNGIEAFAEMYSAMISNQESWKTINEFFPESVKIFKEILKVVK